MKELELFEQQLKRAKKMAEGNNNKAIKVQIKALKERIARLKDDAETDLVNEEEVCNEYFDEVKNG